VKTYKQTLKKNIQMDYTNENGVGGNCAFNGKSHNALLLVLKRKFIFFMLHIITCFVF